MKIGFVNIEPYPPESRIDKESRALASIGHEVHIFCPSREGEPLNERLCANILVNRFAIYTNSIIRKLDTLIFLFTFDRPRLRRELVDFIDAEQIEVLHVVNLPAAMFAIYAARRRNLKVVLDFFENYPYGLQIWQESTKWRDIIKRPFKGLKRWLNYERWAVNHSDATIVDSAEFKDRLVEAGLPEQKINVIQNTIDPERFLPSDGSFKTKYRGRFVIIYLGVIGPQKGIELCIEALPEIRKVEPNALFLCVGAGFKRHIESFLSRARELGVEYNLEILGRIPHKQILSVLEAGDIALLHLEYNVDYRMCSPHKLFEYMYAGLPVIVSPAESVAKIVQDCDCGTVAGYNPSDIARAVINYIENPEQKKRQSLAGRKAVEERFDWNFDAERLGELYRSLA